MYSIAAAVAIPGTLRGSSGVFKQYGLAGELVRTGGIAVAFGCQLYVIPLLIAEAFKD